MTQTEVAPPGGALDRDLLLGLDGRPQLRPHLAAAAAVAGLVRRGASGASSKGDKGNHQSKKPTTGSSTGNLRFWWEFGEFPVEFPVAGFYQPRIPQKKTPKVRPSLVFLF